MLGFMEVAPASWREENRQLTRLAFPTLVATLSTPFVSLANTAMVGHLPGAWPLAAVAMASVIYGVLVTVLSPFRGLSIGLCGQWFGRGEHARATDWTLWGLVIAFVFGGAVAAAGPWLAAASLALYTAEGPLREGYMTYLTIRLWELPFVVGQMFLLGHLRGYQRAWFPMAVTVLIGLSTVGLSAWWIYGLGWGVEGAARAAVAANGLGFLASLVGWWVVIRPQWAPARFWDHRTVLLAMRRVFGWGVARSLLLMGALAAFTVAASHLGTVEVAAHAVLMELWLLSSFAIDGFAYGQEALVARRLGEGDRPRLRMAAILGLAWCLGVGALFALLFGLAGVPIAGLFTSDARVAAACATAMAVVVLLQPVVAVAYWADGILTAAVDLKAAFWTVAAGVLAGLLLQPWSREHGLLGVWWGVAAFSIARSAWALWVCRPYLGDAAMQKEAGAL